MNDGERRTKSHVSTRPCISCALTLCFDRRPYANASVGDIDIEDLEVMMAKERELLKGVHSKASRVLGKGSKLPVGSMKGEGGGPRGKLFRAGSIEKCRECPRRA